MPAVNVSMWSVLRDELAVAALSTMPAVNVSMWSVLSDEVS